MSPRGFGLLEIDAASGAMRVHAQQVRPFSFPEVYMQFWREEEMLSLLDFVEVVRSSKPVPYSVGTVGREIYRRMVMKE